MRAQRDQAFVARRVIADRLGVDDERMLITRSASRSKSPCGFPKLRSSATHSECGSTCVGACGVNASPPVLVSASVPLTAILRGPPAALSPMTSSMSARKAMAASASLITAGGDTIGSAAGTGIQAGRVAHAIAVARTSDGAQAANLKARRVMQRAPVSKSAPRNGRYRG